MAHLAVGADFELAVEMQREIRLGEDVAPFLSVLADQIMHFSPAAPSRDSERPAGYGADVLLELRRLGALDRPMAGIVHPRRDLVDDEALFAAPVADDEQLDRKDADIVERLEHGARDSLCFDRGLRVDPRRRAGARENMMLMLVLAKIVSHDLAL